MLSVDNYNVESWVEKFPDHKVDLNKLTYHKSWADFVKKNNKYFDRINNYFSDCLDTTKGKINIFPYPDLVFNALTLPLDKVRVVILGQDPYFNCEVVDDKIIPEAMGLSFSVPVGIKIPSSLKNIFRNQLKFKVINELPKHGNLTSWKDQGCLLLNSALTVQKGNPNSHAKFWHEFTNNLIKYISDNCKDLIFVLWGRPAYEKLKYIDEEKHFIIASSHPSGLSCNKKMGNHGCFDDVDHFNTINNYLKEKGYKEINWKI